MPCQPCDIVHYDDDGDDDDAEDDDDDDDDDHDDNGADDNGADDDDDDDNGADDDAAHAHVDAVVRLSQIGVRQTLRKQSSQTELHEPGCCSTQAT